MYLWSIAWTSCTHNKLAAAAATATATSGWITLLLLAVLLPYMQETFGCYRYAWESVRDAQLMRESTAKLSFVFGENVFKYRSTLLPDNI